MTTQVNPPTLQESTARFLSFELPDHLYFGIAAIDYVPLSSQRDKDIQRTFQDLDNFAIPDWFDNAPAVTSTIVPYKGGNARESTITASWANTGTTSITVRGTVVYLNSIYLPPFGIGAFSKAAPLSWVRLPIAATVLPGQTFTAHHTLGCLFR